MSSPVCFADTSYFIALLSPQDQHHQAALRLGRLRRGVIVTTQWVLVELLDGFADRPYARAQAAHFVHVLEQQTTVVIVPAMNMWFAKGFELFEERADKNWSLTDCISFVVMSERNITEALTADRHFAQAGFVALLEEGTT